MSETSTKTVLSTLDAALPGLEETYKHLHRHPELSMQEHETNAFVAERLREKGYEVHEVGGGVIGVLRNGEGSTVLFRADTDALPVQEDTGLDYSSQVDGVMHACGHDMHTTAGLAVASLLAEHQDAWSGTYLALFQPAEETAEGARSMVDAGLTNEIPRPDVALAQHVMPGPAGTVLLADGPRFSLADSIHITVFGKGSHGSMPHLGVDPVVLASTIVLRLQGVVARELAPDEFGVVTVGSLHAGSKSNVISDRAELRLNVRSYDEQVRERILAAIERIVRAECDASGSPQPPTFEYYDQFPLTENDGDVTARARGAIAAELGEDAVGDLPRLTGSEDFSHIPNAFGTPYTYWTFGGFPEGADPIPNHNPRFAPVVQPTMSTAVRAAVAASMAWLAR